MGVVVALLAAVAAVVMSRASAFPQGTVVGKHDDIAEKRCPSAPYPWRTTTLRHRATDDEIQAWLDDKDDVAQVLRYGYEPNGRPEVEVIPTDNAEREIAGYPCGHRLVLPDSLADPS